MLKLKGIADFAFDCKTATLTMEAGATLRESDVLEALKKDGFTGESFSATAPPPIAIIEASVELLARGARFDAATCRTVALQLAAALPMTSDWQVGADGRARGRFTATPPAPAALEALLLDALAKPRSAPPAADGATDGATGTAPAAVPAPAPAAAPLEWRLVRSSARLLEWPASVARANVTLAAPLAPSSWPALRTALATLEQIVAWSPGGDGTTLLVWTKEPCANLESRLSGALAPLAIAVARVDS